MTNIDVLITDDKRARRLLCRNGPVLVQMLIIWKLQFHAKIFHPMFIGVKCSCLPFPELYTDESGCYPYFSTVFSLERFSTFSISRTPAPQKGKVTLGLFYAVMITLLYIIKIVFGSFWLNSPSFYKMHEFGKVTHAEQCVWDKINR